MTILINADGRPAVSDVMKNKTSSRILPLIRLNLRLWRSEATQIRTIALWGIFGGDFIESDGFCAVFVVEYNQNFFIIKINGVHERVDKRFPVAFYVRVEFAEPGQPEPNLIFA